MARQLDPAVEAIIKKLGINPNDALWNCHGTWCMYHRAIEQMAAQINIKFEPPIVLEANGAAKSVALCVTGHYGDRTEWSIGEASPQTCKNAYPYAMAEKRAKDRVALKLIGLHGLIHSDAEVTTNGDAELDMEPEPPPPRRPAVTTMTNSKCTGDFLAECKRAIDELPSRLAVYEWLRSPNLLKAITAHNLTATERDQIKDWARRRGDQFADFPADDSGIPPALDRRRNGLNGTARQ